MAQVRPMYMSDLARVIAIIGSHDEDDAEAAQDDFQDTGVEDHFVLELQDTVIGVTGFRRVSATDKTAWISWTYVDATACGQGHGKAMMLELLDRLRDNGARKLFVKVSNYNDPEDGKIYENALKLYQRIGFVLELTNNDFYDEGEDQLILGMLLQPSAESSDVAVKEEKPVIRFNGLYEIAESDGAFTFSWVVKERKTLFGKRSFSVDDLLIGLRAVKTQGGRKVFITFPSNLPLIHQPLHSAGFKYVGKLSDYYENGVDEMHFCHDLQGL